MKKRIIAFALTLLCLCGTAAFAGNYSELPKTQLKQRPDLPEMKVYFRSKLAGRAYLRDDEIYLSLKDVGALYNIPITIRADETGFTASAPELEISALADTNYLTVNYRYIFLPNGYILCGNDVYLPLDAIMRIFGIKTVVSDNEVGITSRQCKLITGTEDYYKLNMPADYQYWLPRIIKIETVDEPLEGKIAIGNIILNRVKSPNYPDTIYKVIFDNNTGVQFAPATTGSLTAKGDDDSWLAACLCYEGYNPIEDCLYFANPDNNGNYWFRQNCVYVTTIGRHEFFK